MHRSILHNQKKKFLTDGRKMKWSYKAFFWRVKNREVWKVNSDITFLFSGQSNKNRHGFLLTSTEDLALPIERLHKIKDKLNFPLDIVIMCLLYFIFQTEYKRKLLNKLILTISTSILINTLFFLQALKWNFISINLLLNWTPYTTEIQCKQ